MAEGSVQGVVVSRQGWKAAACMPMFMACQLRMVFTVLKERKREGEYATECVWPRKPEMLLCCLALFIERVLSPVLGGLFTSSLSELPEVHGFRATRGPSFSLTFLT